MVFSLAPASIAASVFAPTSIATVMPNVALQLTIAAKDWRRLRRRFYLTRLQLSLGVRRLAIFESAFDLKVRRIAYGSPDSTAPRWTGQGIAGTSAREGAPARRDREGRVRMRAHRRAPESARPNMRPRARGKAAP